MGPHLYNVYTASKWTPGTSTIPCRAAPRSLQRSVSESSMGLVAGCTVAKDLDFVLNYSGSNACRQSHIQTHTHPNKHTLTQQHTLHTHRHTHNKFNVMSHQKVINSLLSQTINVRSRYNTTNGAK